MFQTDKELCWWECNLVAMVLFLFFVYSIKYESKEQKHAFNIDDAAFVVKVQQLLYEVNKKMCKVYCFTWRWFKDRSRSGQNSLQLGITCQRFETQRVFRKLCCEK